MCLNLQVRATNNFCQMLLENEQEECFSDWSDAVNVRVINIEPSTISMITVQVNDTTTNSETIEATSSCMYIRIDISLCVYMKVNTIFQYSVDKTLCFPLYSGHYGTVTYTTLIIGSHSYNYLHHMLKHRLFCYVLWS